MHFILTCLCFEKVVKLKTKKSCYIDFATTYKMCMDFQFVFSCHFTGIISGDCQFYVCSVFNIVYVQKCVIINIII